MFVAPVQGEEEHGPPPGTVLVSVRKEGNAPPCMKPLVIRLTVPVHRASSEGARRYGMGDGVAAARINSSELEASGGREAGLVSELMSCAMINEVGPTPGANVHDGCAGSAQWAS